MSTAYPLIRNLPKLRNQQFDLLVVGGGIYGAWTAYDAAQRGLSVALIERDDWAAGTSSASSKLIHGGLRYLEHYDFALVRHALAERRVLTQIAPHLVRPLRFIVPVFKDARAGLLKIGAGLTLYDWLAGRDQPVPRHRRHRPASLARHYPFMSQQGLRGGFSYGDCQEDDARMTLAVVAAAQACGAVCANRLEALTWLRADTATAATNGKNNKIANGANRHNDVAVTGTVVRDGLSGAEFSIHAKTTVVAAGPWMGPLLGKAAPRLKLVKGVHLILPAIPGCNDAFLLTAPQDGRVFFVIPWYGRTLVGTTESNVSAPSEAVVTVEETRYLLNAVAAQLPGLGWTEADVVASFAGVRSLQAEDTENLSAVTREFVLLEPMPRLLLPVGGKYTTARCDAAGIVDQVETLLGRPPTASRTGSTRLPGTPEQPFADWIAAMSKETLINHLSPAAMTTLLHRHGTRIDALLELIQHDPALGQPLHTAAPFLGAEVELALRDEMALSVGDVLRRRMPLQLLVPASAQLTGIEQQLSQKLVNQRKNLH